VQVRRLMHESTDYVHNIGNFRAKWDRYLG